MIGFESALTMLQAISASPAIPLARASCNNAAEIMRWLDAGAYGLICPMISTRADAEAFVSCCRYPPVGIRSFGPSRGLLYGGSDYFAHANAEILTLAMIETREGLENLDAIVDMPGLDGIYVGPNDLAVALGHAPSPENDHPEMVAAIDRIVTKTKAAGKMLGIFCSGGAGAAQRRREGFDMVTPGNDAMMIKAASAAAIAEARGC